MEKLLEMLKDFDKAVAECVVVMDEVETDLAERERELDDLAEELDDIAAQM